MCMRTQKKGKKRKKSGVQGAKKGGEEGSEK
jgi:hypothetical protein